jgi:hypothetical protein
MVKCINKADNSGSTNTFHHDAMCGSIVNKSVVLTSRGGVYLISGQQFSDNYIINIILNRFIDLDRIHSAVVIRRIVRSLSNRYNLNSIHSIKTLH